MFRTSCSSLIFLILCLIVTSCHPLKDTIHNSFTKTSYSSNHLGEQIQLKQDRKFYYVRLIISDSSGLPTRYELKGSYKIKRNKIYFDPDSVRLDDHLILSPTIVKPKKITPKLSPKENGVFLVQPKQYKPRSQTITEFSETSWEGLSEESLFHFYYQNYSGLKASYRIQRDSIWKIYRGEDLEFYQRPTIKNKDWKSPH